MDGFLLPVRIILSEIDPAKG